MNAWVAWFAATHDLVPPSAPLFAVPLRNGGYTVLTRQAVADALKGAAVAHGEPASDYSTHSCRASGAASMMHCGHAEATISVAGRWAPNSQCVRGYTRYTRHLMAGISSEMATAVFRYCLHYTLLDCSSSMVEVHRIRYTLCYHGMLGLSAVSFGV